jgi:hypothetical protein
MNKNLHLVITVWSSCKVIREQRFDFTSIEKVDEFLRLAHILQIMVKGEKT